MNTLHRGPFVYPNPNTNTMTQTRQRLYAVSISAYTKTTDKDTLILSRAAYVLATDDADALEAAQHMAHEQWPNADKYNGGICLIPDGVLMQGVAWTEAA